MVESGVCAAYVGAGFDGLVFEVEMAEAGFGAGGEGDGLVGAGGLRGVADFEECGCGALGEDGVGASGGGAFWEGCAGLGSEFEVEGEVAAVFRRVKNLDGEEIGSLTEQGVCGAERVVFGFGGGLVIGGGGGAGQVAWGEVEAEDFSAVEPHDAAVVDADACEERSGWRRGFQRERSAKEEAGVAAFHVGHDGVIVVVTVADREACRLPRGVLGEVRIAPLVGGVGRFRTTMSPPPA